MIDNTLKFRRFGTMLDCSRNAVMTVDTVKRWIDLCSELGQNMLMLYTEDTYEIKGEPYFGYGRGRYSSEELKEIDFYGRQKGIEVVPCIQTLAHLGAITRWETYKPLIDANDILLAGDERVYELIDKMFSSISECFTSKYINVGMDEAHMIGRGKYYDLHGDRNRSEILIEHITRVSEIAKKYGFTLCMWSDMFFKLASGGEYYADNVDINKEITALIPDNVQLIYWDYYSTDVQRYKNFLTSHAKLKEGTWFAGGLWTWQGFAPHNNFSIEATKAALSACLDTGAEDVFLTLWGDDGSECSKFATLPALFYSSELAKGNTDVVDIKERFAKRFGIDFDAFMLLDLSDTPNGTGTQDAEKYLLFNDPFVGLLNSTLAGDESERYKKCAEALAPYCENEEWGYLFNTQKTLCETLEIKADLSVRTRNAYIAKDNDALNAVIADYDEFIKRLKAFYNAFEKQWYKENKGYGFEVQDIRLGGLMRRAEHCRDILKSYADGKITAIEELEEPVLDFECNDSIQKKPISYNSWRGSVSANNIIYC